MFLALNVLNYLHSFSKLSCPKLICMIMQTHSRTQRQTSNLFWSKSMTKLIFLHTKMLNVFKFKFVYGSSFHCKAPDTMSKANDFLYIVEQHPIRTSSFALRKPSRLDRTKSLQVNSCMDMLSEIYKSIVYIEPTIILLNNKSSQLTCQWET